MKCPICAEETAGQETQQWGPEWAHKRCVKAYNIGKEDARAAVQANVPDGWRPIETAPKDGTAIWAFNTHDHTGSPWQYECSWNGACWYHGFGDGWSDRPPSHWRPMPAAPGAAAPQVAQRCPNCDDTGDVHTIDGQWRGTCHCPAGQAINSRQAQLAERKPLRDELVELADICFAAGVLSGQGAKNGWFSNGKALAIIAGISATE